MSDIEYVPAQSVAETVVGDAAGNASKGVLVVDVRGSDEFNNGHVRGAVHHPSELWKDDSFVDQFLSENQKYDRVIFHCQKSQVRGPTCAKIFAAAVNSHIERGLLSSDSAPAVQVMRGGFESYGQEFEGRKDLIE